MTTTLIGAILLGALGGLLGNLLLLRRMALLGDMMSHSLLPGLCIGFIVAGYTKNYFYLFIGAAISATLANFLNEFFLKIRPFKPDATLAILISGFYAIGALMIASLSKNHGTELAGVKGYLLGQAALIQNSDLQAILLLLFISILFLVFFYKRIIFSIFDSNYLSFLNQRPRLFLFLSTTLIVFTLLVSLQMVGAILAASFLLIPAASAIFVSRNLQIRFLSSLFLGALIGALGTLLSSTSSQLPTGPVIVVCGFVIFILFASFGPNKSLLSVYLKKLSLKKLHLKENILRSAYYFHENNQMPTHVLNLMSRSSENRDVRSARKVVRELVLSHVLHEDSPGQYSLTDKGIALAQDMVRKHRIWESFIVEKLGINPNNAHDNAEKFEHYMDDSIVSNIEEMLDSPVDPHGKNIPPRPEGKK